MAKGKGGQGWKGRQRGAGKRRGHLHPFSTQDGREDRAGASDFSGITERAGVSQHLSEVTSLRAKHRRTLTLKHHMTGLELLPVNLLISETMGTMFGAQTLPGLAQQADTNRIGVIRE